MEKFPFQEEYSKELLISESATLMDRLITSWPDLVVDDIAQTGIRAEEYADGKIKKGSVGWHITVGSATMGIAKQVSISMPIKNGKLMVPSHGITPNGEEVRLDSVAFSNWCRLGVK